MNDGDDILEIRFAGNGVSPLSVKPHEVAELIVSFEKALLSDIKERHPEIDTSQLLFAFTDIKNESLGLGFVPKIVKDIIVRSYSLIASCVGNGDLSSLNNETIQHLKTFTKFSKNHGCVGELKLNGERISSFTPTTELQYNKNQIIKGDIRLFGRVIDAGGDRPNVHLKVNDERILIFFTSEANAKLLAHKLYEKDSLVGTAKWDAITNEILEFKLLEIVDFAAGGTLDAINELRKITSGYWDKFNTTDEINNQLLRD